MREKVSIVLIFLVTISAMFLGLMATHYAAAQETGEPDIVVKDIDIDPATRKVIVTVENIGADLHYQKTMWIYASDLDSGRKFAGMLVTLDGGSERSFTLTDNWILNVDYEEVEEKESGVYNIRAWVGNSSIEKKVVLDTASIRNLVITDVAVPEDYLTASSVKIIWSTSITATGTVVRSDPYGGEWPGFPAVDNGTTHYIILNNLLPNKKYTFYIKATASGGRSTQTTYRSFVTKAEAGTLLPDLTIKEVNFVPMPHLNEKYNGHAEMVIANNGQADATSKYGFSASLNLRGHISWGDKRHLDSLTAGAETKIIFDLQGLEFTQDKLKVSAWVDSNSVVNDDGDLLNDNLSIMESNEDNNTYYREIKLTDSNNANNEAGIGEITKIDIANTAMSDRLKGRIILKVKDQGKAYYINPANHYMYYLGRPDDAFRVMRTNGIGISNADLYRISVGAITTANDRDDDGLSNYLENTLGLDPDKADTDGDGYDDGDELKNGYSPWGSGKQNLDQIFSAQQKGKIFLQIEKNGEAWYVNPEDGKRYFLGRPADAFNIMRKLGLGISNNDFNLLRPASGIAGEINPQASDGENPAANQEEKLILSLAADESSNAQYAAGDKNKYLCGINFSANASEDIRIKKIEIAVTNVIPAYLLSSDIMNESIENVKMVDGSSGEVIGQASESSGVKGMFTVENIDLTINKGETKKIEIFGDIKNDIEKDGEIKVGLVNVYDMEPTGVASQEKFDIKKQGTIYNHVTINKK